MKSKLTSRKFWVSVFTEIGSIAGALTFDELSVKIVCIISAICNATIYVLTEGKVDWERAKQTVKVEVNEDVKDVDRSV